MRKFVENNPKVIQIVALFVLLILCLAGIFFFEHRGIIPTPDEYYYSLQEVSEGKYVYYAYNFDYSLENVSVVINNELKNYGGDVTIKFTDGQPRMIQSTIDNSVTLYIPHNGVAFVQST